MSAHGQGDRRETDRSVGVCRDPISAGCARQGRTAHDGLSGVGRRCGLYHDRDRREGFAGTVDDPHFGDIGGAFDRLNFGIAPVSSAVQDASLANFASDTVSGFAVNSIATEVPVSLLTRTGNIEAANSTAATIGVWASTSRPRTTVRRSPLPPVSSGSKYKTHRMGNPLINDVLIGTGFKDRFSLDQPRNDARFASFFPDLSLARVLDAAFGGAARPAEAGAGRRLAPGNPRRRVLNINRGGCQGRRRTRAGSWTRIARRLSL
jgi:hypothetical protein